ncbi:MAG: hypothetical protein MJK04_01825, partial [Psychrosphaera sp.]|nr:hypothetical protein [Psychrosphaera sp.]
MTMTRGLIYAVLWFACLVVTPVWAEEITSIEQRYKQSSGSERINYLEQLSSYYSYEQPAKAKEYALEAITLLQQFPDLAKELAIGYSLIDTLMNLGEYDLAQTYAVEFNQKAISGGNKEELATTYFSLALV